MDNVKLPPQYFLFFITYAGYGRYEVKEEQQTCEAVHSTHFSSSLQCKKLIDIHAPMLFISMASDDLPSAASPRNGEADKLFVILSTLIRCFDVSTLCKSSQVGDIARMMLSLNEKIFF